MNQPQQKLVETFTSPVSSEELPVPIVQIASGNFAAAAASPARDLQAKLSRDLQSAPLFEDRHAVLKMIAVFTAACAGTWVFGALLYLQV